jgi:hypothetical protein
VSAAANRAEPAIEYVVRRHADRPQLPSICFGQVDSARAYGRTPFREVVSEALGNIRPDFIAAGADGWADRDVEILRSRTEIHRQFAHGGFRYLRGSPSPARMDGSHGARMIVQDEQGDTVGGPDGYALRNMICDQRVAFAFPIVKAGGIPDDVRMDLPQRYIRGRVSQPRAKAMLLPREGFECLAAVNTVIAEAKFSAQIAPTRSRDFFEATSARYQPRVRRRPSSKVKRGA